jgi:hypothetical protein
LLSYLKILYFSLSFVFSGLCGLSLNFWLLSDVAHKEQSSILHHPSNLPIFCAREGKGAIAYGACLSTIAHGTDLAR